MAELNLSAMDQGYEAHEGFYTEVMNAIDGASDQDTTTYLVYDGKRIAAIVPVDVAEHYLGCMGEVLEHGSPGKAGPGTAGWVTKQHALPRDVPGMPFPRDSAPGAH